MRLAEISMLIKSVESRLMRRQRNWIANVRVAVLGSTEDLGPKA